MWTVSADIENVQFLVVGGGGAGGGAASRNVDQERFHGSLGGAGGGGGGVVTGYANFDGGSKLLISVGKGGTGGAYKDNDTAGAGAVTDLAGDTIIKIKENDSDIVYIKAGAGGSDTGYNTKGGQGASSSGSRKTSEYSDVATGASFVKEGFATEVQILGKKGGKTASIYCGGGGGAGSVGSEASSSAAGNGGAGYSSDITGETKTYGAGGGGGSGLGGTGGTGGAGAGNGGSMPGSKNYSSIQNDGEPASANQGGGGGGAGFRGRGGNGGSGVVVFRYVEKKIKKPVAISNLVYTGEVLEGVPEGFGYYFENNSNKATEVGTYTAVAKVQEGKTWSDGTTDDCAIEWTISTRLPEKSLIAAEDGYIVRGLGNSQKEIAFVFTKTSDEINWAPPATLENVQFLVVGGGGGGGADTHANTTHGGAGGGGGGVVTGLVNFASTENVSIVVGHGGEGGSPAALKNSKYGAADNGAGSSFRVGSDKYVSVAGGGGDNGADISTNTTGTRGNVGNSGGSSAGSRPGQSGRAEVVSPEAKGVVFADMTFGRKGGAGNTTDDKYYNYYSTAGGGGGATEEGGTPTDSKFGGKGGAGVLSVVTGEPLVYGSGGGGGTINGLNGGEGGEGAGSGNVAGVTVSTYAYYMDAAANQGGGGGGGSRTISGGNGGSGIVAFRFEYNEVASVDGYGYLDLGEAISAADAGDTVTLLANAGNIELGKSLALNLNGCTVDQITLTDAAVTLTAPEGLNVKTSVDGYEVAYDDGVYSLQKVAVVQIGETTYATLAEAVAAAQSGDTIVLIENVELAETVTIPVGKTLTIDLNGKSISMEESIVTTAYALNNLGTLTLTDSVGTGSVNARGIYNGYGNGGDNVSSAKLIIQSGTYNAKGTNGGAAIFNYGIVEINGGTFTSVGGYSLNNQSGASMTVAGATANNGIYNTGATLTINSGNISGNRSGCHVIYAWNSNVTINGGEFYNNNSGNATIMTAGSSQLTINNGIFGIKDGRVPGNGNTWTSCLTDTANTATMTVNGGTFNGGFRVQAGTTMTINGGSYNDCYGSKYNISGTVTVKGGSFTDATAKTFANENLAEGYELAEDGTVVKAAPTTVEVGTLAELQDALADNSNDLPIVVTATIKIPAGDTVELDLNGKTVTSVYQTNSTDKHIYPLNVYGNLTIKDTKGNGSITGRGIYVQVGSKLTIDGGSIYAIDSNGGSALWMYGGDVVINGGHIEQKAEGTYNFAINAPAGTVTVNGGWVGGNHGAIASSGAAVVINGGELVCTGTAGMTDNVLYTYDTGSITINGGTFVADNDVPAGGCCVYDANGGVTINGGTFGNSSGGDVWGTTGGTTIKGGTFSNLIETQHIADGYKLGENGQVVAKPVVAKIGEVGYATLKAAVEAVEDNGTITLLGNVTITEATRTHNSGTWYDGIYYVGDKSFTIDFAGFTVTQDGSVNDYLLNFKNDGSKASTITLKNGTIDAGTAAYCAICTSSASTQKITINTENINIVNNISNGSTVKIRGGAEFNAKAGTKITGKNSYLGIECVASTVNIYDGAEIYMNGTGSYNGCLVGACGGGVVNVYGGYGKGVKGGFIAMTSGGTINISGGEWIANTDGSVGDNSNLYVLTAQNNKYESGYVGASVINVTGGIFRGGMDAWVLNDATVEKAELNITGGNFNVNPANYLEAGYLASEAAGIYTVAKAVAKIGDTYYTSLEDAFNAAAEGDTIVMLADATPALTSQRAITKAATIDLGGKTLTLTEDDLYFGTTTFKNGTIIVDPSVKPSTAVFWMFANQTLTFDGVKIVATGVTGTYLIGLDGNNSDLNLLNGSEIFVDNTTALDLDIICVNASTGNDIVINNSKVKVTNLDGRVFFRGNYTISGTSDIDLSGITKAGFRIEAGQTLTIADTATVDIEGEPRDGGIHLIDYTSTYTKADTATVNATVNKLPVVKIGETDYDTIAEALAAAKSGDTIELLTDVTVEGTAQLPAGITIKSNDKKINGSIRMLGDLTLDGPLTITGGLWVGQSGETLTATLSGAKLTASYFMFQHGTYTINADIDAVYGYLSYNGTFEVNSTIHTTGANGEVLYINGNVTLNDGAVLDSDNSVFVCNDNAVLTLKAGSSVDSNVNITTSGAKVYVDATGMTSGANANITGNVTNSGNGTVAVVNSDMFVAQIVNGKIVLVGYVAKIGEQKYTSLQSAIDVAVEGDMITLLSDVEQANGVLITDKKLTIDLNGKTFTVSNGANTNNRNFKINGASEVVISNGTMVAAGNYSSGAYGTVRTEGTAKVTLTDLKLYNYRGNGLNIKALNGTTVTMADVEICSQYGGGIEAAGGTIELTDVVVEQKGMYIAPYNSMAISVNGGGTVTVQSGTYSTECIAAEDANNQGTSHGPWVAGVLNSGGTLIINGGTFSNDNFGENSLATYARGAILADTAANIQINGGTFNALKAIIDITNNLGDASKNPSATLNGGTYSADPRVSGLYASNLIKVAEGYVVTENNGVWTVAKAVAKIGDTFYTNLVDAFKAATSGCTIDILDNVTVEGKWDCRDYATGGSHSQFKEAVTINGNGYTLKFTGTVSDGNWNTIFRFEENATVNNLTVDISEATGAQRVISAKKSLSVDGLTIVGSAKYGIIYGEGASAADLAATEIVVKNSTLTGTRRAISDNEGGKDVKSVVITGNTLEANAYASASESITFNNNNAKGEVDLRSYTAENVLRVEAKGNTLTAGVKNYIYAKNIDAQAEFTSKRPAFKVATKDELDAAVAEVQDGDVIEFLADITTEAVIVIDDDITINGNGKTITSSANRVIRIAADVTINNLNMVSTAKVVYPNDIRGVSVDYYTANDDFALVLNNCSVDFTDATATDWAYAVNQSGNTSTATPSRLSAVPTRVQM